MTQILKNKYVRRAKISEYKFRKMVKYFAEDMSATQIAEKIALNRNTVNRYLNEIRERIVEFCEQYAPFDEELREEHEVAEFFANKEDVPQVNLALTKKISNNLGILKRRGKVYAEMIANCTTAKLGALLNTKQTDKVTVHAVEIHEDEGVIAVGYDNDKKFADKPSYVENLDNFWQFTKSRMLKFQGVAKHKLYHHLKESEFRFNFRNDNLYKVMLDLISTKPIA